MPPEDEEALRRTAARGAAVSTELTLGLLLRVALECMSPQPHMVYNKSTKEYEPDGTEERDYVNAIRALTEIDRVLLGSAPEEDTALRLVQVDFGPGEDYAR